MPTTGSAARRDLEFTAFVRRHRPGFAGAALLLHGDPVQAERLVEWVMAQCYTHGSRFFGVAIELLTAVDPRSLTLPWEQRRRVELVDRAASSRQPAEQPEQPARPSAFGGSLVVERFAALPSRARAVLVLRHRLGLSTVAIAETLDLSAEQVDAALSRGLLALSDVGTPAGGGAVGAIERLRVGPSAGPDLDALAESDLAHGRRLVRRRRGRWSAVAAAAACLVLLAGYVLWPDRVTEVQVVAPPADASPTASPSPTEITCMDPQDETCRVQITRVWRYRMFAIVGGAIDPKGRYFNGYSYGYDARYDSDTLWDGRGGALGLDVFNDHGGTVVFIQVATSRKTAVTCGTITHHRCIRQQMMDFNFFTMTDTTDSRQGVEVQYCPDGKQVITLAARDTTRDKRLVISRGQLLEIIQDPGLKLPPV